MEFLSPTHSRELGLARRSCAAMSPKHHSLDFMKPNFFFVKLRVSPVRSVPT